jgi:hypothetical protein
MSIRFPLQVVKSITDTAVTGTVNYPFLVPQDIDSLIVKLYTGATFTGTNPTLDVYFQTTDDGGTTWYDVAHFAQFTAAISKQQANWITIPVNMNTKTVPSTAGSSTLAVGLVSPIPLLSRECNIIIKYGGTQVANTGVEVRVLANSQSRAA